MPRDLCRLGNETTERLDDIFRPRGYRERGGGSRTQATRKNSHIPLTQHPTTSIHIYDAFLQNCFQRTGATKLWAATVIMPVSWSVVSATGILEVQSLSS